jgi:hypothetical protein
VVWHSYEPHLDAVTTKARYRTVSVALKFRPWEVCGSDDRCVSIPIVGSLVDEVRQTRLVSIALESSRLTSEVAYMQNSIVQGGVPSICAVHKIRHVPKGVRLTIPEEGHHSASVILYIVEWPM